jgi:hypothetical protein
MIGGLPTDRFMTDDKEGNRNARSWTLWFNQVALLLRALDTNGFGFLFPKNVVVQGLPLLNYPNDATASAAGVPYGGLYHTAGVVHVCLI